MKRGRYFLYACALTASAAVCAQAPPSPPGQDYCADISGQWTEYAPNNIDETGMVWTLTQTNPGGTSISGTGQQSQQHCSGGGALIRVNINSSLSKLVGTTTVNGVQVQEWQIHGADQCSPQDLYYENVYIAKGEPGCAFATTWWTSEPPPSGNQVAAWRQTGASPAACITPGSETTATPGTGWQSGTGLQGYNVTYGAPTGGVPSGYNFGGRSVTRAGVGTANDSCRVGGMQSSINLFVNTPSYVQASSNSNTDSVGYQVVWPVDRVRQFGFLTLPCDVTQGVNEYMDCPSAPGSRSNSPLLFHQVSEEVAVDDTTIATYRDTAPSNPLEIAFGDNAFLVNNFGTQFAIFFSLMDSFSH